MPITARTEVTFATYPSAPPVRTELGFDIQDPLVVTATFYSGNSKPTVWTIGLDLLRSAFKEGQSGYPGGDIAMAVRDGALYVALKSDEGTSCLIFPYLETLTFTVRAKEAATGLAVDIAIDRLCRELLQR
jgi:hypothetical protein